MTAHAHRRRIHAALEAEPALERLYDRYHPFVRRALRRHYVEPSELEDMTQEVFVVLLRRIDEVAQARTIGAWLYQIARRVAANHHRWQRRHARKHGELAADPAASVVARDAADPEDAFAREQAWGFLREFLESLDEEACAVFVMSEIEGLRGAEIAERLRLTLPMTYARIRNVRARFERAVARSRRRTFAGLWIALQDVTATSAVQTLAISWRLGAGLGVVLLALAWLITTRGGPVGGPEGATGPTLASDSSEPDERWGRSARAPDRATTDARAAVVFGGVVVAVDGTPVPDAIVCAGHSEDADHRLGEPPACVTTGRDGRFRIHGAIAQAHTLEAMARGFVPGRVRGRPTDGVRIVLHPGGVGLSGVVSDVHGGPVEGAWVSVENRADASLGATVRTDPRGAFSLWVVEGPVSLAAGAEGYAPSFHAALAPSEDVRVELGAESVIAGIVVDGRTGDPMEGIRVAALLVPESERYANRGGVAFSDVRGRWEIRGLQPNQYVLDAAGARSWGRALEAIDLGIGDRQDGIRIEMLEGVEVLGRIFDADTGRGCEDGAAATVDRAQSIDRGAFVGEEGLVRVAPLTPGAVHDVRVTCRGYVSARFQVDLREGPVAQQPWPLHRGGELLVRVVDDAGTPLPSWQVEVVEVGVDRTGADGSVVFAGLGPGRHRVLASGPGHPPVVAEDVRVVGDRSEVELRTASGARVGGRVVSADGMPVDGALVALQRTSVAPTDPGSGHGSGPLTQRVPYQAFTDARGAFEHVGVASGEYGLWVVPADAAVALIRPQVRRIGGTPVRTVVVGERDLDLELQLGGLRSISGVVRDDDGDVIADARVFAVREHDGAPPDPRGRPRLSDAEGLYRFDDLPPGTYALTAYRDGGGVARLSGVEAGARGVDLVFHPMGRISGTVRTADGAAVEGYTLVVNRIASTPGSVPIIPAGSKEGRFVATGLEAGRYGLLALAPDGRGDTLIDLGEGEHRSGVVITLEPSAHIEGRLVDLEGRPLAGWIAAARSPGASTDRPLAWMLGDVTGRDGRFAIRHLPPGPVAIVAIDASERLLDAPREEVEPAVTHASELRVFTPEPGETLDLGDVVADPAQ